ncbi:hypothetical protein LSUE1_G004836 [Lachnellula suecica]|uniref:NmrA-like domain-containing protein n=1 Tax=Lachnellula suecica TaxID=602035 RepID=A0A8T9CJ60_9HELO|nr:hypothetical protein LSUE1_G004836 [Lachnellula suecica]
MVKIAVAGGSGKIASGIINALAATKKHEILIISRREPTVTENTPGVTWAITDYSDRKALTEILHGVHTVLSFVGGAQDPGSVIQKNLIDAAIAAGHRGTTLVCGEGQYPRVSQRRQQGKEGELISNVLEYTLFQPGLLLDYFVPPGSTTFPNTQELWIDFNKHRAITLEGKDGVFTLTSVEDLANIVVQAIDYPGEWPVVGGIQGTTISGSELLKIGANVQNREFDITTLKEEDVRAGNIESPWIPHFADPSLSSEQNQQFAKLILKGSLLSGLARSWVVSDEWNRLLPDYKFTRAWEFLEKHWVGKG